MYFLTKRLNQFIIVLFLGLSAACGGGSDPQPEPPIVVEPEPAFSLTLRQETTCDPKALLPGVSVLVYDESPLLNFNTPFTSYTTDSSGYLELDVPADSKISFSINTQTALGSSKVYTFNEVDAGNYDLTVLFFGESELQAECSCETVAFDAELNTGASVQDISFSRLEWGFALEGYDVDYSNNISFENVELCGDDYKELPLVVELSMDSGQEYYGYKSASASQDYTVPVAINSTVVELNKPNRGVGYQVSSSKRTGRFSYFNSFNLASDVAYKTYPDFIDAKAHFILTNAIPATYNGEASASNFFTEGVRGVRDTVDNDNIDSMENFPIASYIDVNLDQENRLLTIDTDAVVSDTNINYTYIRQVTPSGGSFRWYIYSPSSLQISQPLLEEQYESVFSEGGRALVISSLIKVNGADSFTEAVTNRRFNDLESGANSTEFSETYTEFYYRETSDTHNSNINKSSIYTNNEMKEREQARDIYFR